VEKNPMFKSIQSNPAFSALIEKLKTENNECGWGQIGKKIDTLLSKNKVFVVISAGNNTDDVKSNFPGCMDRPNLYTVGSFFSDYNFDPASFTYSSFSNYGYDTTENLGIDYLAPGELIFSTYRRVTSTGESEYGLVSGTSFSAAMVSAILYGKGAAPSTDGTLQRAGEGYDYPLAKW